MAIAPSSGQREPWQFQVFGEARSLPRAKTTAVESSASVRVFGFCWLQAAPPVPFESASNRSVGHSAGDMCAGGASCLLLSPSALVERLPRAEVLA